jgi:hypothetical protein
VDKLVDCFFVIACSPVFLCRATTAKRRSSLDRLSCGPGVYATKPQKPLARRARGEAKGGLWVVSR